MFTDRFTMPRIALTAAAGIATLGLLTACGGQEHSTAGPGHSAATHGTTSGGAPAATSNAQPSASFNDADVTFAQMMIPHHEQAVEMARLAETRAADAEIKELAAKIQAAQDPEIATMTGWLTTWGKAAAPEDGHGGHDMPGMMTEQDMAKLQQAEGAAFDRMFAELMIAHHRGAIEMAKTEQAQGASPEAVQLAKTIEAAQQAEIEQMEKLLKRL
ncbi:lipoprotein [Planobispora rosea]|uniref:Lipoprotein n=2 Tax=Planobispora rosea TaxID=35762 RepID=A0A8J3S465_PLARO|nr:lipoprotein [Planobispora rosea]GIH87472.1 lipoprotein [Planobispora rosea]